MIEHLSQEGGYYPAFDINEGLEDTFINVSKITTQLQDTDGSETLQLVLDGLPEGTIVKLGDSELVVDSNGRVNISPWLAEGGQLETILDKIQIKVDEPDTYTVVVKAISDEVVGDTEEVTQGSFELIVHPAKYAPLVGNADVNLSEEGLNGGLEDDAGKGSQDDTTNSTSISGSISVSDQNGDDVSVAFEKPTETLYSGDTQITWTLSDDNQTLEGYAGSDLVISATINNQGGYDIELLAPIKHSDTTGEDTESFTIPVIGSDGELTGKGAISVTIEDDAPEAARVHHDVSAETKEGANVQLILDTSGSMSDPAGNGQTRLQVMQTAALQLLAQYAALGETRVQLIEFYSDSKYYVSENNGSKWMTVDEASEYIGKLYSGGGTDYDDATKMGADIWDDHSGNMITGGSNVSYFLSDGEPNSGDALSDDERLAWEAHLREHDVTSLAYGIGNNAPEGYLNPISYDGHLAIDTNATIVPDVSQLPPVILQSVIQAVGGNLLVNSEGADGGVISSITIDGVTYSFDGTTLTSSGVNGDVSYSFNSESKTLSIYIDSKHSLVVDLDDGHYEFFGAIESNPKVLNFNYTITDSDGDSSSNVLSFEVTEASDGNDSNTPPIANDFTVSSDSVFAQVNFAPHAVDTEDDNSTTDDKVTSVRIESLPTYGQLYYHSESGQKVYVSKGDVIPETTKVHYEYEGSTSLSSLGVDSTSSLNTDSYSLAGITLSGGEFASDSNNVTFTPNGSIIWDHANQQNGFAVRSGNENGQGQGDEVSPTEFISIKLDNDVLATSANLSLASLNSHFNNGNASVIAYLFKDGVLQHRETLDLDYLPGNGNGQSHEAESSLNYSAGFDEIRLVPTGNENSVGFTLSGVEVDLGGQDLTEEVDYVAIDSDGLESNSATAKIEIETPKYSSDGRWVDKVTYLDGHQSLDWQKSAAEGNSAQSQHSTDKVQPGDISIDVGLANDIVELVAGNDTIYLGESHSESMETIDDAEQNAINRVLDQFADATIDELTTDDLEDSRLNIVSDAPWKDDDGLSVSRPGVDIAHGGGGNDHIYGEGGSDIIFGGTGNDHLDGGQGNDAVRGGSGNDTIIGGEGNDILVGDSGEDIFKFVDQGTGVRDGEVDTIKDFTAHEDKIDISELLHTDADDDVAKLLENNEIGLTVNGDDLELTISDGAKSQTVIIEGGKAEYTEELAGGPLDTTSTTAILNDLLKVYDTTNH
ncbi:MAG: VWA domain-containing protein [Pseudomonadota bacterium]